MSKLFKPFIIIHLHVFLIYGAAPAEARYKISGVRKAGVAVLRSFFNTTRLSTACVDNDLMFTNTKVRDNEYNQIMFIRFGIMDKRCCEYRKTDSPR